MFMQWLHLHLQYVKYLSVTFLVVQKRKLPFVVISIMPHNLSTELNL